jgi:hypothetical protein
MENQHNFLITSPAESDHNRELDSFQALINASQKRENDATNEGARQVAITSRTFWEEKRRQASNYDIDLGYVYATSG